MRLTLVGKLLIVFALATAAVTIIAPGAGLVMAIALTGAALLALAEGVGGTGADAGHEAWAQLEAERKRETLRRGR